MPIPMVPENVCIDLTNDMNPLKKLGTPFCGLKITKTGGNRIGKSSQHTFQKPKSGVGKIILRLISQMIWTHPKKLGNPNLWV